MALGAGFIHTGHLETEQGENCTRLFKLWQLSVCIIETCEEKSNDNLTRQMEHFPNPGTSMCQ